MNEIFQPKTRDEWLANRVNTLGASEVPALFGVHPWLSPFKLFALKTGQFVQAQSEAVISENSIVLPPTERGNLMEGPAFELTRRLRPTWTVEPNQIPGGKVFIDRAARMSSTPDAFITDPARAGRGSLQVKSSEQGYLRKTWLPEGFIEPPLFAVVQGILDAHLSGCDYAYAGAIGSGFGCEYHLIELPMHVKILAKARELTADFWRRVAENDPYPPDFAKDGAVIAQLFADDNGSVADLSGNNILPGKLERRAELKAIEAAATPAKKEREEIDNEIRFALGNSESGFLADGTVISAKTVRNKGYPVAPFTYRPVRIKGVYDGSASKRSGNRTQQPAGPSNDAF